MEKLWTVAEVGRYLGLDDAAVEGLVREGQLTGYQLGGQYLRFRPDQVKALRKDAAGRPQAAVRSKTSPSADRFQRVRDFVYFYDFYIISAVLLAALAVYLMVTG